MRRAEAVDMCPEDGCDPEHCGQCDNLYCLDRRVNSRCYSIRKLKRNQETPNRSQTVTCEQGAAAMCPDGLGNRAGFGEG